MLNRHRERGNINTANEKKLPKKKIILSDFTLIMHEMITLKAQAGDRMGRMRMRLLLLLSPIITVLNGPYTSKGFPPKFPSPSDF